MTSPADIRAASTALTTVADELEAMAAANQRPTLAEAMGWRAPLSNASGTLRLALTPYLPEAEQGPARARAIELSGVIGEINLAFDTQNRPSTQTARRWRDVIVAAAPYFAALVDAWVPVA